MDLGLSEEQELLKNNARDFLEKECPESLVREMEDDGEPYESIEEVWPDYPTANEDFYYEDE